MIQHSGHTSHRTSAPQLSLGSTHSTLAVADSVPGACTPETLLQRQEQVYQKTPSFGAILSLSLLKEQHFCGLHGGCSESMGIDSTRPRATLDMEYSFGEEGSGLESWTDK